MSASYVGPNLRGQAKRSNEKNVRTATHTPVLEAILGAFKPEIVIEHGMGNYSTKLFHDNVPHIVSIEDNVDWMKCHFCVDGGSSHKIISQDQIDELDSCELASGVGFVDGGGGTSFRTPVLERLVAGNAAVIVEHDADSWTPEELNVRLACVKGLYVGYQYVGMNPETAVFVRNDLTQTFVFGNDYVRLT